eukprot:TRINITY_DN2852_c0_g1_i5.p1 TRINITY_DN2852_c0_g1~~TRINITY_DN2852_c0_g1_i5.p1  ORF type:complete len:112 (+),score=23.64 TRINITY_DN2852_c0_g1_i5:369-704(+)
MHDYISLEQTIHVEESLSNADGWGINEHTEMRRKPKASWMQYTVSIYKDDLRVKFWRLGLKIDTELLQMLDFSECSSSGYDSTTREAHASSELPLTKLISTPPMRAILFLA